MRRQPVMAVPSISIRPFVRLMQPGEKLDQRRFARAVLPNEAVDRAATYGEGCAGKRLRTAKTLYDAIEANDGIVILGRLRRDGCSHDAAIQEEVTLRHQPQGPP